MNDGLRTGNSVQRRRMRAARVRRRRLLLADIGIGTALGAIVLTLAPGLAIAALAALLVLAGCGLAGLRERRARRWMRVRYPRRRRRFHPKNSSAVS
jgi:hypothetical protein